MNKVSDNKLEFTSIQKIIGRLMLRSKQQIPCSYMQASADLTELVGMRKKYCKAIGVRVTTNDFFFCAIARAIAKYPLMAGRLDEEQYIHISAEVGIGFAVAAPQGLVVPVIKDVSAQSLPQIASKSNLLLKKSRANKLTHNDLYGANVVLSGLGMYGIDSFYAVAPPGATGIVSMGRIDEKVIPIDGNKMVRKIMSVGLAVNNRIVNDFYAAKFLSYTITQLENPAMLTE